MGEPSIYYTIFLRFFHSLGLSFLLFVLLKGVVGILRMAIAPAKVLTMFVCEMLFALAFSHATFFFFRWLFTLYRSEWSQGRYALADTVRLVSTLLGILAVIGTIAWIVIGIGFVRKRAAIRREMQPRQIAAFQIWLQDILIASLGVGLALTFLQPYLQSELESGFVAFSGAYRIAGMTIAFLVVISVCRYSPAAQNARGRAIFVALAMALCAVGVGPFSMLGAWLVWRAWLVSTPVRKVEAPLTPLENATTNPPQVPELS